MKLIRGRTLAERLSNREALDTLGVFEALARAVGYAHAHGVIHRDLKPANIMVGAFGEVQVMDWGLAKLITDERHDPLASAVTLESDGEKTRAGHAVGTPAFMAPEQARGEWDVVDARSDVFGLGGVLCVMLTGRPPFLGQKGQSTKLLAAQGKIDEAFAALDKCGADLEWIRFCKRCLAVAPADRLADGITAAEAVATLRANAERQARLAEVERAEAKVREAETVRRNKVKRWTYAVASAGLMAVAAAVVVGYYWRQARSAARDATTTKEELDLANRKLRKADSGNKLQVAFSSWETNDLATSRSLLRVIPEPDRGWEWRHVNGLVNGSAPSFALQREGVYAAFSPDGSRIVITNNTDRSLDRGSDQSLSTTVIDVASMSRAASVAFDHSGQWINFSGDGQRLALVHAALNTKNEGIVRVCDSRTLKPIMETKANLGWGAPYPLNHDGSMIAFAKNKRSVVWDTRSNHLQSLAIRIARRRGIGSGFFLARW